MIYEINQTDDTASIGFIPGSDSLSLSAGMITFALAPMASVADLVFITAVEAVELWRDFIKQAGLTADHTRSLFNREFKHEGTVIEMISQISMTTIVELEWDSTTNLITRAAGVEATITHGDWEAHQEFLLQFVSEVKRNRVEL